MDRCVKYLIAHLRDQKGMSLASVVGLMVVAGFLAIALAGYTRQQQRFRLRSQVDGNLQAALDAGYDKALGALNTGNNWVNPTTLAGMTSITATAVAQIDQPNLQYWVKIMTGVRIDSTNAGSVSDTALNLWTNNGDLNLDRTIFVRARHLVTGREAVAMATLHRNDKPPYHYGGDAVAATGNIVLGNNWEGHVYNSCLGPALGAGALPNSEGSLAIGGAITSAWPNSNWSGYNATQGSPPAFAPLVLPASTLAVPGFAKTSTISTDFTLTNSVDGTVKNFEVFDLNLGGGDVITVNGPGMVALWITGPTGSERLGMGGSTSVVVNKLGSTQCCLAKLFTIYVMAQDANPGGGPAIAWNGTPEGSFLLVGPRANMEYRGGGSNFFKGALVVQNLAVAPNSGTSFYYDACLKNRPPVNNYNSPPVITLSWRRVR